jgi:hypothetical protein
MSQRLSRVRTSPLVHVLGFATFPVVFLWAENANEAISPATVLRPLALIWVCALALFTLTWAILRDPLRAGLLTSLFLVVFFTFGRMRDIADPSGIGGKDTRFLVLTGLFVLICGTFAVRAGRFAPRATTTLNLVATALVVLNIASIVVEQGTSGASVRHNATFELPGVEDGTHPARRDVYYLIFDRYANVNTLRDRYGFDNEPFEDYLRANGFYVAEESLANYPKTVHSLASSLSMSYLDDLARRQGDESGDWDPLLASLQGSNVVTAFQKLGYRYEHVGSWYDPTRADYAADRNTGYGTVSEFTGVLLETTIWPTLAIRLGIDATFGRRHYEHALFQFDEVERIARDPDPTFTWAHFLLPHPPYVFDAEGAYITPNIVDPTTADRAYLEQLRYTNRRIRELVSVLLSGPESSQPIIVIQSDEGPHPQGLIKDEPRYDWTRASDADLGLKLRIVNAYHLPGRGESPYPTISPVNTFRLIFSRYFGADLPLLEDRTFVFRDMSHPYLFTDVTSRLR